MAPVAEELIDLACYPIHREGRERDALLGCILGELERALD